MAKINNLTEYPNTTPALTDHFPGTDVSDTGIDPNGETVTFTLQSVMDLYEANIVLDTARIQSGTFADARISQSSVTQHQAALSITESQISDLQSYLLNITAEPIGDLSDVSITTLGDGEVLVSSTGTWINQTLAEAGIQPAPAEGAFVDGDKTKLDGIEAGADVTDTANVTAAGALMDSEVDADIKTLTLPANVTISTFGASLVDDADAAAARTTIGAAATSHTHSTADITSGTFADARIAETNVTQHQAALSITESQISDLQSYLLNITAEPIGDLTDVSITTLGNGEVLVSSAGTWINQTLAEAGIAAASHTHTLSDITDSGTIASQDANNVTITGGSISGITDLAVADGGTGAGTASGARTNLGLVIGTDVQAWDADLDTWATKTAPTGTVVGTSDSQTLTNKTLTAPSISDVIITGAIDEEVYTVTGTTPALDPANGTIQTWTLSGNSTPTDSLAAGESITLMVDDGTAYTITWPTITWVNNGGSAPTLATTGYTVVVLWKVSTTLYGALVGDGS